MYGASADQTESAWPTGWLHGSQIFTLTGPMATSTEPSLVLHSGQRLARWATTTTSFADASTLWSEAGPKTTGFFLLLFFVTFVPCSEEVKACHQQVPSGLDEMEPSRSRWSRRKHLTEIPELRPRWLVVVRIHGSTISPTASVTKAIDHPRTRVRRKSLSQFILGNLQCRLLLRIQPVRRNGIAMLICRSSKYFLLS